MTILGPFWGGQIDRLAPIGTILGGLIHHLGGSGRELGVILITMPGGDPPDPPSTPLPSPFGDDLRVGWEVVGGRLATPLGDIPQTPL